MANNRAVNKSAEALLVCQSPDVCKTPMGSSMVPVAYQILSQFDKAVNTATRVNYGGAPAFHAESFLPTVTGNEAGVGGGLSSGVNVGACRPTNWSTTIRTEGNWIVRHDDVFLMNCAGPKGSGNTKGKVIYVKIVQLAWINEDGTIEVEKAAVIEDAEGDVQTLESVELRDAEGNVLESKAKLSEHEAIHPAPESEPLQIDLGRSSNTGPILGNEAIGTVDEHGRIYLGDGMYSDPVDMGELDSTPIKPEVPTDAPSASEPDFPIEIADDDPELLNNPDYLEALEAEQEAQKQIDAINEELVREAAKTAADVAGLIDPTPISDAVAGAMALRDGDFVGAGLSMLSWIPYAGDAIAKPLKGARTAARVAKLTNKLKKLMQKLEKLKDAVKRAKERVKEMLRRKRASQKAPEAPPPLPKKSAGGTDGGNVPKRKPKLKKVSREIPCFPEGTLVATKSELVPIEQLSVGDKVLTYDETGLRTLEKPITKVLRNKAVCFIEIALAGDIIRTTKKHRFWVQNQQMWLDAQFLSSGMLLRNSIGENCKIRGISTQEVDERVTYNLTVDDCHTYYVGQSGILVHNTGDAAAGQIYLGYLNGEVVYVGQTKQTLAQRMKGHLNDALRSPEKYGWKQDMKMELVDGMDGLDADQMNYHERRIYDELNEQGHDLKNRQVPYTDEKMEKLAKKYCN